ncbi:MAG: hypothetical protein IJX46_07725 [Clostridia bacterium]|nr:hypothetical protein [Clostridia bacterium]
MNRYLLFEEKLCSDELGTYTSFGIKVLDPNGSKIISVSDVSTDKALVTKLCNLCTEHGLDPIHLMDVIEDNI